MSVITANGSEKAYMKTASTGMLPIENRIAFSRRRLTVLSIDMIDAMEKTVASPRRRLEMLRVNVMSTNRISRFGYLSAYAAARLVDSVLFPTPPLLLANTTVRVIGDRISAASRHRRSHS